MATYGHIMLIVAPIFIIMALLEKLYGWYKGRDTVRNMDMISSISSGVSNITKASLGITITIFSYSWMVHHLAVVTLKPTVLVYAAAVIAIDFQMYWIHRLWHRINYLWNTHMIHHSSEEFNLACGLRQNISAILNPFSPLLLPAALLGIPLQVIVIVQPFHFFAQFWYHTRQIGKMGFLEKIIVTPSHHRVHHAFNPEYIDRNYSSLFIIWDKLFGTFQPELEEVPPVYGTTRQVATWNPVRINFQHFFLIVKDAWRTRSLWNKFRIWFMPTGWRPDDVKERFPISKIADVYDFQKYDPDHHRLLPAWSWVQLSMTLVLLAYLFANLGGIGVPDMYLYGAFVVLNIFAFTELMDGSRYALLLEAIKNALGIFWILFTGDWFGISTYVPFASAFILAYFVGSTVVVGLFTRTIPGTNRVRPA